MKCPPLTIALLTYNRCGYLKESLEAILGQTYGDFELMVLDNGSTDGTAEMVLAHRDPRLTYVRHPSGHGPEYNGASAQWFARGERLLVTCDDDILEPTTVARQMAWMDADPTLRAVATNASIINHDGKTIQPCLQDFQADLKFGQGQYLDFYLKNKFALPLSSLMVDARSLGRKAIKGYFKRIKSDDVFLAGDVFYVCALNAMGPVGLIAEPLLRYRLHEGQSSNNMHLVKPELDLLEALYKMSRRNKVLKRYCPAIKAAILRFRCQDEILEARRVEDLPGVRRRVAVLRRAWSRSTPSRARVQDAVLPMETMALLLEMNTLLPESAAAETRWPVSTDACRLAFRAWYRRALKGQHLFSGRSKPRRIAVFGSALVANMVVLEARRSGVEVICCLDSNLGRQGEGRVLGLPVYPHDWLQDHGQEVDAVVLTTEGRTGDWMRTLIQKHLGQVEKPTPSWKEFLIGSRGR